MNPFDKKQTILGAVLLVSALLFSLLSLLLFPQEYTRRVLFFPNGVTGEPAGEEHLLPRRGEREAAIELFVEELVLGPNTLGSVGILPERSSIELLMLRDGKLYLDFSPEILDTEEELRISFDDVLDMTEYNIRYNFPFLGSVEITVTGQLPDEPRFDLSRMGNNR